MSICNYICNSISGVVKDYLIKVVIILQKQATPLFIMYDNYCESLTKEEIVEIVDIDDLLAELEDDLLVGLEKED